MFCLRGPLRWVRKPALLRYPGHIGAQRVVTTHQSPWRGPLRQNRWKPDEDDLVARLYSEGVPIPEIADRLGDRSIAAVNFRVSAILAPAGKVALHSLQRNFTPEEDALLLELRKDELTVPAMLPYFAGPHNPLTGWQASYTRSR